MTYLVIAAVFFAVGIKLGEKWGREQGYTRCLYDLGNRVRYADIITRGTRQDAKDRRN